MAEGEEELKSLLMKVKEESEKDDLELNIQKTKIMASGPITSWQIDVEKLETVTDFYFLAMTLVFWMLSFKPAFSLSSFIFIFVMWGLRLGLARVGSFTQYFP